jgi:hypothetical protein
LGARWTQPRTDPQPRSSDLAAASTSQAADRPIQFRQEYVAAFEDMTPRDSDCQACGLKHLPAIMVCGWFIFCLFLGVFAF